MSLDIKIAEATILKPQITVFGVGGAGGNATNNMIKSNLEGANFVVANTDAQALENSASSKKIQLGTEATKGLGAGASPEVGKKAAEEAMPEILEHLKGSNMIFITAGMGGGTGTGAAPVIAKTAKELGILTVAVVTKPFHFEGPRRMRVAEEGLKELQKYVDTLIIIPNQNLFRVANERTTFAEAFNMADEVLHSGVRGITDLMVMPGLINLDFADVRAVMSEMGKAMMGTGEASGDDRARIAAEEAISNPLLDSVSMKGAKGVLINITGGADMTLFEVDEAANRIREEVDPSANIIFGSTFNDALAGTLRVSVVATGIDSQNYQALESNANFGEQASSQEECEEGSPESEDNLTKLQGQIEEESSVEKNPSFSAVIDSINKEYQEELNEYEQAGGEDNPRQRSRVFVSDTPVFPKKYVGDVTGGRDKYFADDDEDVVSARSAQKSGFFSKFGKAFPFGSSRSTREEEPSSKDPEEAYAGTQKQNMQDDQFDVPAFLRRKPK